MKKLISTNGLSHEDWLKYRKQGIGGSDAGAICGLNPYVSPMSVFYEKTSLEVEDYDNESMRQGRDLEEYVARRFMEETGLKVRRSNAMYQNEEYPFMLANVDRLISGENMGLECKTASAYNADKWTGDSVPAHYEIQCHHYMAVTGAKAWYLAVVILGREFKYKKIERDEELIQNLIAIEKEFWEGHVLSGNIPDPDGSDISNEVINRYFPGEDVMLRSKDKVLAFQTWEQFVGAVDPSKCSYKNDSQKGNEVIGICIVDGDRILQEFKRAYYQQGWIFKNPYAFKNEPQKPCYVPELSNTIYTREDFLNMCNDQADIAEIVFEAVDWQHPETYLNEQYTTGEMTICNICGKIFLSYEVEGCPYCSANGA